MITRYRAAGLDCKDHVTVLTVRNDGRGRFDTIEAALDYMSTQPTMELIATTAVVNCAQWSNWVSLVSGTLLDTRPGDLFYLDNDDPALDIYQMDYHHYRVLSAIDNATEAMPGLYLEHCIVGPTQNGYTAKIYRPAKFIIDVGPGQYTTTGATMPDGYDVVIRGQGRATLIDGLGIYMPIYGNTEFTNFIQNGSLTRSDTRTVDAGNNLLDAGFGTVAMYDMWCEGEDVTVLGNYSPQSVRMKNVPCSGFKGHRFYGFLFADFMQIENVTLDAVTSMELCEIITHPRRCSSSHKKITKNCYFRRSQNHSTITASGHNAHFTVNVHPLTSGMPFYEMDFIHCSNIDDNLQVQAENKAMFGFTHHNLTGTGTRLRFIDCEIVNKNSHDYDFRALSGYTVGNTLYIEFIRTKGYLDAQITHNFVTGGAIVRYKNHDSYQTISYVAGIIPDAGSAQHFIVGALTGNILILGPTSLIKGQEITLSLEQDATGSRTVTWSGAAWKVHSNPVGGASQKAIFKFYYDGTHLIQSATPVWV